MKKMVFLLVGLVVMSVSCKDAEETLRKAGVVENTVPVYKKVSSVMDEGERLFFGDIVEDSRTEGEVKLKETFEKSVFPDYYGGCYRSDGEDRKIVILLTENTEENQKAIVERYALTEEKYVFETCENSRNELLDVMRQLTISTEFMKKWKIQHVLIRERENDVEVCFDGEPDEEKLERFKREVMDSPIVVFDFTGAKKVY